MRSGPLCHRHWQWSHRGRPEYDPLPSTCDKQNKHTTSHHITPTLTLLFLASPSALLSFLSSLVSLALSGLRSHPAAHVWPETLLWSWVPHWQRRSGFSTSHPENHWHLSFLSAYQKSLEDGTNGRRRAIGQGETAGSFCTRPTGKASGDFLPQQRSWEDTGTVVILPFFPSFFPLLFFPTPFFPHHRFPLTSLSIEGTAPSRPLLRICLTRWYPHIGT